MNTPTRPSKVYFTDHLGTFDVDAVEALVPSEQSGGFFLSIVLRSEFHVLSFTDIAGRDAWRMRLEAAMGILHEMPETPEAPIGGSLAFPGMPAVADRLARGLAQGGPEAAEPDPAAKQRLGYCVMAGCQESAGDGSIVCRTHAGRLNANGRVDG